MSEYISKSFQDLTVIAMLLTILTVVIGQEEYAKGLYSTMVYPLVVIRIGCMIWEGWGNIKGLFNKKYLSNKL